MRLPVIQTCGECGHCKPNGQRLSCMRAAWSAAGRGEDIDPDQPPPSWCPLRTGPDEAEFEALRAVAEAAETADEAQIGVLEECVSEAREHAVKALRALRAAIRRLDEVRRG